MSVPKTTDQWVITGKYGFDRVKLKRDVSIPALGDFDNLIKVQAVSLNYRDLIIPKVSHCLENLEVERLRFPGPIPVPDRIESELMSEEELHAMFDQVANNAEAGKEGLMPAEDFESMVKASSANETWDVK